MNAKKSDRLYALIDTNVLLHFRFVTQIDWPKVLGAAEVCLILSPMLIRELDDIKDGMRKPGRSQLAQRVSGLLTSTLRKNRARPDDEVSLQGRPNTTVLYTAEDDLDIDPRLKQEKQDDHIIAAGLHFKQRFPDREVVAVTGDYNFYMRAQIFGLVAHDLEDLGEKRTKLPLTEEEKELKRLKRKAPTLKIDFGQQNDVLLLPYSRKKEAVDLHYSKYKKSLQSLRDTLEERYRSYTASFGGTFSSTPITQEKYGAHHLALLARKAFGLEFTEELLAAEEINMRFQGSDPDSDPRVRNFRCWKEEVKLFNQKIIEFHAGDSKLKDGLQKYSVSIKIEHSGGSGIQDAVVDVGTEAPIQIWTQIAEPTTLPSSLWREFDALFGEAPGSRNAKFTHLGNFHPFTNYELEPLILFLPAPQTLQVGERFGRLSIKVTGLNIEPIRAWAEIEIG